MPNACQAVRGGAHMRAGGGRGGDPSWRLEAGEYMGRIGVQGDSRASRRGCGWFCVLLAMLAMQPLLGAQPCADPVAASRMVDLAPDQVLRLAHPFPGHALLVEERGSEIALRRAGETDFTEVLVRPPRLGAAVVEAGVDHFELRLGRGQPPNRVLLRPLCTEADRRLHALLQRWHVEAIEAGAQAAAAVVPAILVRLLAEQDPGRRAWLQHALANALNASGRHDAAATAFLVAERAWSRAGDPDRATVALLAAGEDFSRAAQLERAERLVREAEVRAAAAGLHYFRLRAQAQLCLQRSRRGDPRSAVVCEEAVTDLYLQARELAEAGARRISIANTWMRLGDLDRARANLDLADSLRASISMLSLARLHTALGVYHLQTGNLNAAVGELQTASSRLGALGLPRDQAMVDARLARAAQQAGALDEARRLLQQAVGRLTAEDSPDRLLGMHQGLAELHMEEGAADAAAHELAVAEQLCERVPGTDCLKALLPLQAEIQLARGELSEARATLAELSETADAVTLRRAGLVAALVEHAAGDHSAALAHLDRVGTIVADLDLDLRSATLRAQILARQGRRQQAADGLLAYMESHVLQAREAPAMALRASARRRIAALQSVWLDLAAEQLASGTEARLYTDVYRVLQLGGPSALLSTEGGLLPDGLRRRVSESVVGRQGAGARETFLGWIESEARVAPAAAEKDGPAPLRGAHNEPLLRLLPLVGAQRVQLLAAVGSSHSVCIDLPREEYDELLLRFGRALSGATSSLGELDRLAQDWFERIVACVGEPAYGRWSVLASPATGPFPWPWIASRALLQDARNPCCGSSSSRAPPCRPTSPPRANCCSSTSTRAVSMRCPSRAMRLSGWSTPSPVRRSRFASRALQGWMLRGCSPVWPSRSAGCT